MPMNTLAPALFADILARVLAASPASGLALRLVCRRWLAACDGVVKGGAACLDMGIERRYFGPDPPHYVWPTIVDFVDEDVHYSLLAAREGAASQLELYLTQDTAPRALAVAARSGKLECMRIAHAMCSPPTAAVLYGALVQAAASGDLACLDAAIAWLGESELENAVFGASVIGAAMAGSFTCIQRLQAWQCDMHQYWQRKLMTAALYTAASHDRQPCLDAICEVLTDQFIFRSPNLHAMSPGYWAFEYAARAGSLSCLKTLHARALASGNDFHARILRTALWSSSTHGHAGCVSALLSWTPIDDYAPLCAHAVEWDQPSCLQLLRAYWTPRLFTLAAERGSPKCLALLYEGLQPGANMLRRAVISIEVNGLEKNGALDYPACLRLLKSWSAAINIEKLLCRAAELGYPQILPLLREWGADRDPRLVARVCRLALARSRDDVLRVVIGWRCWSSDELRDLLIGAFRDLLGNRVANVPPECLNWAVYWRAAQRSGRPPADSLVGLVARRMRRRLRIEKATAGRQKAAEKRERARKTKGRAARARHARR